MAGSKTRPQFAPQPGDALLLVDVQVDFLPGGALAVADGDAVIAPLNRALDRFVQARLPVFATRDRAGTEAAQGAADHREDQ